MRPRPPAFLALLFGFLACRPGEGDNCVCEGECRGGLVCAQGGRVLEPGMCVSNTLNAEPGRCIQAENLPDSETSLGEPPDVHDVGSKRDFEPGRPTTTTTTSGGSSESSSGTASSSESSSSSASSSESTGSGSSSSGSGSSSSGAT